MTSIDSAEAKEREVEEVIYDCMDLGAPRSFFLYAGAGSGKTRTLVEVLKRFRAERASKLRLIGRGIAVITYTNAACDEIKRRLEFDTTFHVSTIHSFAWELIQPFQSDIREWQRRQLNADIVDLEAAQTKGRAGSKASTDRPRQIESKRAKLAALDEIRRFIYNPNGDNATRNSLNHAEVIKMTYEFLQGNALLKEILVRQFPILLIDESQDTKSDLMEAFLDVERLHRGEFVLGLFGDMMQRIYADGKTDLQDSIPTEWARPEKSLNYRSRPRVVRLVNSIRETVDEHRQVAWRSDGDGVVRLFIKDASANVEKQQYEMNVCERMSALSADDGWVKDEVKTLTLEHHMAASRGGFLRFFAPLSRVERFRTGLLDGSMAGIAVLANQMAPLLKAKGSNDEFEVARIVRNFSPLLGRSLGKDISTASVAGASQAVSALYQLVAGGRDPLLIELLREVHRSQLLTIPEALLPIVSRTGDGSSGEQQEVEESADRDAELDAWEEALNCNLSEFLAYSDYISDRSRFGTHQGIKGLEFPRVMVILDDEEARGFMFSYEKLLGAESESTKSSGDAGKETSSQRTRRLLYVTCSRAEESLAVVAYTKSPTKVRQQVLERGWFSEEEIVLD